MNRITNNFNIFYEYVYIFKIYNSSYICSPLHTLFYDIKQFVALLKSFILCDRKIIFKIKETITLFSSISLIADQTCRT